MQPTNTDSLPDSARIGTPGAAEFLGLSEKTLATWRSTGRYGLRYIKVGRCVQYRVGDLREFLNRRTANHTGELA